MAEPERERTVKLVYLTCLDSENCQFVKRTDAVRRFVLAAELLQLAIAKETFKHFTLAKTFKLDPEVLELKIKMTMEQIHQLSSEEVFWEVMRLLRDKKRQPPFQMTKYLCMASFTRCDLLIVSAYCYKTNWFG